MIASLYTGISGLDSYQNALNVESNNISNVNTVAYKSDNISFADMLYQNGYGTGTTVDNIAKSHTQGGLKSTSNSYDMAIEGQGFFVVETKNLEANYTRAGNFKMGDNGTLQTVDGLNVLGLSASAPEVIATNPLSTIFNKTHAQFIGQQSITTETEVRSINIRATDYGKSAVPTGTSGDNYKSKVSIISDADALANLYRSQLSLYATNPIEGTPSTTASSSITFDPARINNSTKTLSLYVDGTKYTQDYDTDATTTLKKLTDQLSIIKGYKASVDTVTGEIVISSLKPGIKSEIGSAKIDAAILDTKKIADAVQGDGLAAVISIREALKKAIEDAGGEFIEISNTVSLADEQSLTLGNIQLKLDSINVSTNPFGEFTTDDGNLYIKQGDNRFLVGRVVTATFNDILGLEAKGNNLYAQSVQSGEPMAADSYNTIKNKTLELSNADVGDGLVNLMVFQRSFEANSKSITTSDELLKTAIQLKK
ncbi:MAG: hypothetical protein DRG78_14635 [Epsilonproteobacteria bacterium]|nr:MAG: hypothetical protein DRG78_14635 [Campylobacterota bacterium]